MSGRIIAVDFDGTLCTDCYPKIGEANGRLIRTLKELQRAGDRIILEEALCFCGAWGLEFDAVNENLPEIIRRYGSDSRKIYADIYIDDRSISPWEWCENERRIG